MKFNEPTITNVKTTVALKKPYTYNYYGVTNTIAEGRKFDVRNLRADGLVVVLGHGAAEVIPHEYLGTYTKTYNVTKEIWDGRNGFDTFRKTVKEDVTKTWVAFWKKEADKKAVVEARANRINLKNKIAALRKTIRFVKKGEAERELNLLLANLKNA